MSEGKRFDGGKSRVDLIPTDALESLGEVYSFGVEKYGERNWEKGMAWGRVFASMMRHAFAFWRGEDRDQESGMLHTQHMAWNAVALLAYQLRRVGEDNRATSISTAETPGAVITHPIAHPKPVPNRINKGEAETTQQDIYKTAHAEIFVEKWAVGDIAESREGKRYVLKEVGPDGKTARAISDGDPAMETLQLINLLHFKKVS